MGEDRCDGHTSTEKGLPVKRRYASTARDPGPMHGMLHPERERESGC